MLSYSWLPGTKITGVGRGSGEKRARPKSESVSCDWAGKEPMSPAKDQNVGVCQRLWRASGMGLQVDVRDQLNLHPPNAFSARCHLLTQPGVRAYRL